MTDDIAAAIDRLTAMVDSHERALRPVGQNGLPIPDHTDNNQRCRYMPGTHWHVGKGRTEWVVIVSSEDDDHDRVFIRPGGPWDWETDVESITADEARRLAGALVAAADMLTDELARARQRRSS